MKREPELKTSRLNGISAAVLAGGLGTRLRSVVPDRPKVLAQIHGRPFVSFVLDQLAGACVRQVVLCVGYKGGMVKKEFGHSHGPIQIIYSQEPRALGTGGALRLALRHIDADPFLVLNGDSYCAFDFGLFWDWHTTRKACVSLLLTEVEDTRRFGQVTVDDRGQIQRFTEKDPSSAAGWINAGVYIVSRDAISRIPRGKPVSLEADVFPNLIGQGLYGYQGGGRFIDIGTPSSHGTAEAFFRRRE